MFRRDRMLRGSLSALEGMPPPACAPVTPLPVTPDVVAPPVVAPPVVAGGVVAAPVPSAGVSSVLEQPAMAAKTNAEMIHVRMNCLLLERFTAAAGPRRARERRH